MISPQSVREHQSTKMLDTILSSYYGIKLLRESYIIIILSTILSFYPTAWHGQKFSIKAKLLTWSTNPLSDNAPYKEYSYLTSPRLTRFDFRIVISS